MKRLAVPLLIILVALTAFWFRDRWLPQPPGTRNYLGYVEGETILLGAPQAGRLVMVAARKGARVDKGETLFALDQAQAGAEVDRATAAVATAQAAHANLLTGKRQPELDVIAAQIEQVRSALDLARKELKRASMLTDTGTAAQSREDAAVAQVETYEFRLQELAASRTVAELAARDQEIISAASRIDEAKATAELARRKLSDLTLVAPVPAAVEDVFFEEGEWVAAGQPVVALLAPDRITIRFYVPQAALAAASAGTVIRFHCDGCGEPRAARIVKVAASPEFTPPVIYSEGARAKLVYLVEALPERLDSMLRPGLPVEVEPLQ